MTHLSKLKLLFSSVLAGMIAITLFASFDKNIFVAIEQLWPHLWFRATLADAYFGFLTFYAWVVYKQKSLVSRLMWFVLIMCFGNIAMAFYVLRKISDLPEKATMADLLLNEKQV